MYTVEVVPVVAVKSPAKPPKPVVAPNVPPESVTGLAMTSAGHQRCRRLFTTAAPVPPAAALFNRAVPALTVTPPVKVLAPVKCQRAGAGFGQTRCRCRWR